MNREQEINDYLHGRLDAEASLNLESDLHNNSELMSQFNDIKNIFKGIKESERQDLKSRLKKLSQAEASVNTHTNDTVRKLNFKLLLLVAACIIPFLFLINSLFYNQQVLGERLYAEYYTNYPNTMAPIVRDYTAVNPTKKAFIAYEARDYRQAIELFTTLLKTDKNPDLKFYLAMSYLNDGNSADALPILKSLLTADTQYVPQAYWYTALIYLKNNDTVLAIKTFNNLKDIDPIYKAEERDFILKELQLKK